MRLKEDAFTSASSQVSLVLFSPETRALPHGGQYDLVEQVVVKLFSHFQARPLHGHGGGEAQDDAQAAQDAEHGQIPRVTEAAVLQHRHRYVYRCCSRVTFFACTVIISIIKL